MTDSIGPAVVIGSACRCTIFLRPIFGSHDHRDSHAGGGDGVRPPNLAWDRSTLTRYASSGVTWLVTVSASTISPSRTCDAAWSITAAAALSTCERAKGLPRVTSVDGRTTSLRVSGFPFQKFTCRQIELLDQFTNVVLRSHLDPPLHLKEACSRRTVRSTAFLLPSSGPRSADAGRLGLFADHGKAWRHAETDLRHEPDPGRLHAAPGDDLGWSGPSDELFQWWVDQGLAIGPLMYGRKLWEAMSSHWPTGDQQPDATPAQIEFARNWRDTPKVAPRSTGAPTCDRTLTAPSRGPGAQNFREYTSRTRRPDQQRQYARGACTRARKAGSATPIRSRGPGAQNFREHITRTRRPDQQRCAKLWRRCRKLPLPRERQCMRQIAGEKYQQADGRLRNQAAPRPAWLWRARTGASRLGHSCSRCRSSSFSRSRSRSFNIDMAVTDDRVGCSVEGLHRSARGG